jgi:hypothetical protein
VEKLFIVSAFIFFAIIIVAAMLIVSVSWY